MPESCRIFGVASAPAVRITSRRALTTEPSSSSTPVARLSFKHYLVNAGRRPDGQVRTALRLAQERFGGAAAAAAAGRGLVEADALLPSAVEVFVVGNADLLGGADEGPGQRMTIGAGPKPSARR